MLCEFPRQGYTEGHVNVRGARVHYLHAGSGRPLLLIHGLVGSSANWRRNIDALAKDASVYAIDMVNMGESERIAGIDAGLEATADRIVACMDALGLAQADFAAHSHGGAVVLMLAARHPERVRSLILFAPANPFSDFRDSMVRFCNTPPGRLAAYAVPYLPRQVQRIGLGRMYGDPARISEGDLQAYTDGLRVQGTVRHILEIVRGWFREMAKLKIVLPQVASIPTLLVWGCRDRAVDPASAMQLQRVLWQSELRIVRGGGHIVFEEMAEQSNRLMLDWLRRDLTSHPLSAGAVEYYATRVPRARRRPTSVPAPAKTSAAV